MPKFRKRVKRLLESISSYEIERNGANSFFLISKKSRGEAWFSYQERIKAAFELNGINYVIDAGANVGQFAKNIRQVFDGQISSFEPVSSIYTQLSRNSSADPKWEAYQMGLGSEESKLTINVAEQAVFSSFLKTTEYCEERFGKNSVATKEEEVVVRRLDAVLDEILPDITGKNIFLKMDTQGFDQEVFKGLGDKLEHVKLLQSEVSLVPIYEGMPHWTESIATYEKAGFNIVGLYPVNWDASCRVIEYDCLMVRR